MAIYDKKVYLRFIRLMREDRTFETGPVIFTAHEVDIDEAEGNGISFRNGHVFLDRLNRGGTFKC